MDDKSKFWLDVSGAVASLIGLVALFFSSSITAWLALCIFTICACWVARRVVERVNEAFALVYPDGYAKIAIDTRYTCLDGKHIAYSVERIIQSKKVLLSEVKFGFLWTGTNEPIINAEVHSLGRLIPSESDGTYSYQVVNLNPPLRFNEFGIIVLNMQIDDSNQKSKPHVNTKVDEPIVSISWRVELGSDSRRLQAKAKLERSKMSVSVRTEWELIRLIDYSQVSECYEYRILNPEPGYFYRLEWERF